MPNPSSIRVYLDTSVIGGYYDHEFLDDTRKLFDLVRLGLIRPVVSEMVMAELSRAPNPVIELLNELIDEDAEILPISPEAVELQEAYLQAGVLSRKWEDDAMHVALASIHRVDAIASWNFKHLIDPRRAREFNGINLTKGFGLVEIRSPGDIVRTLEAEE
jgi:predicted nucleic acid-binding protein